MKDHIPDTCTFKCGADYSRSSIGAEKTIVPKVCLVRALAVEASPDCLQGLILGIDLAPKSVDRSDVGKCGWGDATAAPPFPGILAIGRSFAVKACVVQE